MLIRHSFLSWENVFLQPFSRLDIGCGFILLLIILFVVSCSSEKNEYFNYSYDILSQHLSRLPEETQRIDFTKSSDHKQYIHHGWGHLEPGHRWSNSLQATVLFYTYDTMYDQTVEITWRAMISRAGTPQVTDIMLNGNKIDTVISPPTFSTTTVVFPASAIKLGLNTLGFRFSYVKKSEKRNLSVAFKNILFRHAPTMRERKSYEWTQKANSSMAFLVELPAECEFDINYRSSSEATSSIEVIGEKTREIRISLPSDKTSVKKRVHFSQPGTYMLRLVTDSELVWSRFHIKMQKPKEPPTVIHEEDFSQAVRPDILVYVVDTLRADHLGCYGYHRKTSPYIDAFAKKNALYRNAYATSSWTRASGASIMTGLLPRNHHTMTREEKLPDELVTMAEMLQQHGYYTVYFNTNGNVGDVFGFAQGYDEFIRLPESNSSEAVHVLSDTVNEKIFHFLRKYENSPERKPLFMLIWVTDPHGPYTPPDYAKGLFNIQKYTPIETTLESFRGMRNGIAQPTSSQIEFMKTRYDQEIFATDNSFGSLLDRLKYVNLYQDMIIVFTADHGEEFYEHGGTQHGLTLYNEQIRVPLIIKTKQLAKGMYEENAQITDIYPTILDMLSIEPPYPLDGISLVKHQDKNRILYFEENLDGNDLFSRLDNTKKLIFNRQFNRPPSTKLIPVLEVYTTEDIQEKKPLTMESFEDYFRLQQLLSYMRRESTLKLQRGEPNIADIPSELDQKLRDLGYVK